MERFCAGGELVSKNPAEAFQSTLQAAQAGYVPAQEVVGMMYAVGKGVQQDYKEAAKWFLTAAEAGNPRAAANFVATSRSLRGDVELAARWAQVPVGPPGILSRSRTIKGRTTMKSMNRSSRYLAAVLTVAGCCTPALRCGRSDPT